MKLVFVTQQVDPADPVLGATVAKLRALAARVDELVVISLAAAAPAALPANCRVITFGGGSRLGRGVRFARALAREVPGAGAVVAHMSPVFALLAAPVARPLRVPVLLWYAHWHASTALRAAAAVSTRVISVDAHSFPIEAKKLVPIGHGIDFGGLTCHERDAPAVLRVLVLGRYSPAKGIDTILRAVESVPDARLEAHGTTGTAEEERHLTDLHRLVEELGIGDRVELGGPVRFDDVPELHRAADVLVNNMRAGAPDKVVFEAMGSCLPVLASNPGFAELVADIEPPLLFARDRPGELADRLRAYAALSAAERSAIGRLLRERAVAGHSVESWADAVVSLAR
jgi:glycosyltransferase involved in cell wall biosynthesis